jgi:hypothetical protein
MKRLLLILIALCILAAGCDTMPDKDPGYYVRTRCNMGELEKGRRGEKSASSSAAVTAAEEQSLFFPRFPISPFLPLYT